jgi:D-sedoheptulose 7-phosphate isomerase
MADLLVNVKSEGGRIFFLGVGGSAGNCSHAVNDFRKIVGIESYAPTDNVSELTARTNDEGWSTIFVEWLKISKLQPKDILFILSVGGGNLEKNISPNLVEAIMFAKSIGAKVTGIVGRDGGYTAQVSDACVIVPTVNPDNVTPHSEAFQAVIWHLLVSHPKLKVNQTKWESTVKNGIY